MDVPDELSPDERLAAIAALLARVLLRLKRSDLYPENSSHNQLGEPSFTSVYPDR